MPVTDAYWRRARELAEGRSGNQFVIFESPSPVLFSSANVNLAKLGLSIDESACNRLVGQLGATRHEYEFCEVK